MMSHQRRLKKKSRSGTRSRMAAERLQQLERQLGQQRTVIVHQQDQLVHQQTTIDADRAARTPDCPGRQRTLRVWNKPETFTGETHECIDCFE